MGEREGIKDYQAHIKSNIYMAKKNGFLDTYTQEIKAFVDDFNIKTDNIQIICNEDLSGINEITKRFSKEVLAKIYYSVEGI